MSAEDNKALVRRVIDEAWNRGDLAVVDEVYAPDHRFVNAPPGTPTGPEGIKENIRQIRRVFPDYRASVEEQIAEGERVAICARSSGTHRGELQTPLGTLAPTDKRVEWSYTVVLRFRDGRCVETWINIDALTLLEQLGAIPAPAAAAG